MNTKKIGIFFLFLIIAQNIFCYNYGTKIYGNRGRCRYTVYATNKYSSGDHMVQINDMQRRICRCIVFQNQQEVMGFYEIVSGMDESPLEELICSIQWDFSGESNDGWLWYYMNKLYE